MRICSESNKRSPRTNTKRSEVTLCYLTVLAMPQDMPWPVREVHIHLLKSWCLKQTAVLQGPGSNPEPEAWDHQAVIQTKQSATPTTSYKSFHYVGKPKKLRLFH